MRWVKVSPAVYAATTTAGVYQIDGNNPRPLRWRVTYPDGDYGRADSLAEAKDWALSDFAERSR